MKTPEEVKKGLECCYKGNCENCPYREWKIDCGDVLKEDARAYIQQLEAEREDALELIGRLIVILKKYPNAATNGCAYAAHQEIKKWLLHIKKPLPEMPEEDEGKIPTDRTFRWKMIE